jgi:pimeloyl-ACP methyl ester carboxylesterase
MWGTPHLWSGLRAHFEALGHATSVPALPFHDADPGAPPDPKLGTTGIADYVDAIVADARAAPATPVIIGHSMGGMLAQLVAAKVQPQGLVLLSPAGTAQTARPSWSALKTMAGVMTGRSWWNSPTRIDRDRARWGIFNSVPPEIAEAEIDRLVWDSGRVTWQMGLPWLDRTRAATVDYARLTMPALVVVGEEDRITPVSIARATARELRGPVDYRELPGAGHWLFHEPVVSEAAGLIEGFLERL